MFTLFFVAVQKGYCLPTSYQNVGVHIINPYLFHTSKHFGKRVTLTCMPYCNVWAEVVYRGFPKSKVFTKTLLCLFPAHYQSLYLYHVSYVGVLWLVRFTNSTRRRRNSEKGFFLFDTFPIVHFLTNRSFDGIVTMM